MIPEQEGIISAANPHAGQRVFVGHFICSQQGRKIRGTGISNRKRGAQVVSKSKSYGGGCIFVDAATGHVEVKCQTHFNTEETIQAIWNYDQKARDNRIVI